MLWIFVCVSLASFASDGVDQIAIGDDDTSWNRVSMSTCGGLFGAERVARKKPHVLRKPSFWKDMITRSQEDVAGYKNIVDAELELRPMVEEVFEDNKKMMGDVWCESVEDLVQLATDLTSCEARRALLLVLFYLDIGDVPLLKTSHILTNKKPDVIPKAYEMVMEGYYRYGQHAKYCFAQGMLFSCIDCLTACAQGSVLFSLPTDLKDPWSIGFHQEKEKGYLEFFEHDWTHAAAVVENHAYFNSLGPYLYERFVQEVLNVIGERWEQKGIEYLVAGYDLIHEKDIINWIHLDIAGKGLIIRPLGDFFEIMDIGIAAIIVEVSRKDRVIYPDFLIQQWEEDLIEEALQRLSPIDCGAWQKEIGAELCRDWLMGDDSINNIVINVELYRDIAIEVLEVLYQGGVVVEQEKNNIVSDLKQCDSLGDHIFLMPILANMQSKKQGGLWCFRLPTRQTLSLWSDEQKAMCFSDMKQEIKRITFRIDKGFFEAAGCCPHCLGRMCVCDKRMA